MASSDSQINNPQNGHPKRAELPVVNTINKLQMILRKEKKREINKATQNEKHIFKKMKNKI